MKITKRITFHIISILIIFSAFLSARTKELIIDAIRYPILTNPAILMPSDSFNISLKSGEGCKNCRIKIFDAFDNKELLVEKEEIKNGITILHTSLPDYIKPSFYNLKVEGDEINDISYNSVKVISEFPDSYYFIHLTDMHIRPRGDSVSYEDEFLTYIKEFNIINPLFVVMTGDQVSCGKFGENEDAFRKLIDRCLKAEFPMFHVVSDNEYDFLI